MLSIRCTPFWCRRPQHTVTDHTWTLPGLLLSVPFQVQILSYLVVWWPTSFRTWAWPAQTLSVPRAGWPGLLLSSSAEQWTVGQKSGPHRSGLWRLLAAVFGGGCQWTQKSSCHGSRQWWYAQVFHCWTSWPRLGIPSRSIKAGQAISKHHKGCADISMGRWWKRLFGTHLSPQL